MNKILLLLIFIVFASCASHTVVTPLRCDNKNFWHNNKFDKSKLHPFKVSERISIEKTESGNHRVNVEDILEKNGVSCDDLQSYSISFTNDKIDVLSRILLMSPTQTIVVEGLYSEAEEDTVDSSANSYFEGYEVID